MQKLNSLNEIFQTVEKCTECKLYKFRNKTVFAEGDRDAKIMVIGLSPGQQENKTGKLFIGPAASGYILKKYKLGEEKISKVHGQLFEVAIGDLFTPRQNIKIIPMFHPAAALHNPAFLSSIKEDWQKLSGIVHI